MLQKIAEWRKAIVGLAAIAIPFLNQMGFTMPEFLTADWLSTLLLALTPVLVYIVPNAPAQPGGASVARSPAAVGLLALAMALLLSGCGLTSPFETAENSEQRYVAASGTYEIVLESARNIAANPSTPIEVVRAIDDTQKNATAVFDSLDAAFLDYLAIKAELDAGESTEEKLAIATLNVDRWIDQAIAAYQALARATK